MKKIRTYTELIKLPTFEERFNYLKLDGVVGAETFGRSRYLNQVLYHSYDWEKVRQHVIIRDNACDLGVDGWDIHGMLYIHHINPISEYDLEHNYRDVIDPEFLICTCLDTHNAIHYGNESATINKLGTRFKGDTCPWKVY